MKANGHANGHAKAAPLSPLDEAAAAALRHAEGMRRLSGEKADQLVHATQRRADAETQCAAAREVHDVALRASVSSPSDAAALDRLTRAASLLNRDRAVLDQVLEAHAAATAAAHSAAQHAEEAERAHEVAALSAKILDPSRRRASEGRGARVLGLALELRNELAGVRADLEEERGLVARARELGALIDYSDGLPAARGFARALLERGLDLGVSAPTDPLRWAFELLPHSHQAPLVSEKLLEVASLFVKIITRAPSPGGRVVLEQATAAWDGHRNVVEVARAASTSVPARIIPGWNSTALPLPNRRPNGNAPSSSVNDVIAHGMVDEGPDA